MSAVEVIMSEFQAGKEKALQAVINLHGKSLRYFAYRLIRNKEAAEEIVADSFFKLWNVHTKFNQSDKIKAFLYISTRNACYDYLDSPRNRVMQDIELSDHLVHPQKDLLVQMIESELVAAIYEEINRLPSQQAAVFRMSFLEGLSTEEICVALNITENAVFLARSRALRKLRLVFSDKKMLWWLVFLYSMARKSWIE